MKQLLIAITLLLVLFVAPSAYAWSPLPVRSGWDGSTVWTTDMDVHDPGVPTGDQIISTWDNEFLFSEELRYLFMVGRVSSFSGLWIDGKLNKTGILVSKVYCPPEIRKKTKRIIIDIAGKIYNRFKESLFNVSYYPQFQTFSIILHPDKSTDVKRHAEIAAYLETFRAVKYKEYWE